MPVACSLSFQMKFLFLWKFESSFRVLNQNWYFRREMRSVWAHATIVHDLKFQKQWTANTFVKEAVQLQAAYWLITFISLEKLLVPIQLISNGPLDQLPMELWTLVFSSFQFLYRSTPNEVTSILFLAFACYSALSNSSLSLALLPFF